MGDVRVVETAKGKFKVLVNDIQRGVDYTSKEYAEYEAEKIRKGER